MTKTRAAIVLAVLLAVAGGAAWYAWDQGRIGNNPRAPTKTNFEHALTAALNPAAIQTRCLHLPVGDPVPEMEGTLGLRQQPAPGLFAVAFSTGLRPELPYDKRKEQIRKFQALAKIGFFEEADTKIVLPDGAAAPAKRYTLTWLGWENMSHDSACFPYGNMDSHRVLDAAKAPTSPAGLEVWEVTYNFGSASMPDWTRDEELRAVFPELANPWGAPHKARLIRGDSGWLSETQVKTVARNPEMSRIASKLDQAVPEPGDTIASLMNRHINASAGHSLNACLRLPYQDADESARWEDRATSKPLFLIFYTLPDRAPDKQTAFEAATRKMRALENAGFVQATVLNDTSFQGRPAQGGVRYTLAESLKTQLSNEFPWCVVTGEWKAAKSTAEPPRQGNRAQRRVKVRYELVNMREWARRKSLGEEIPELKIMTDYGLAVSAVLNYEDTGWRVAQFKAYEPTTTLWAGQRTTVTPGSSAVIMDSSGRVRAVPLAPSVEDARRIIEGTPSPSIRREWSSPPPAPAPAPEGRPKPGSSQAPMPPQILLREVESTKVFGGGLSATYCCAGAYGRVMANHGHASGKVYFEATIKLPHGTAEPNTYTQLGLAHEGGGMHQWIPVQEAFRKHKSEATFGVAADLDAGKVYVHANGEWIHGPPGARALLVQPGTTLFAAATIGAGGGSGKTDVLTANFGAASFRYPVPDGFRAYSSRR